MAPVPVAAVVTVNGIGSPLLQIVSLILITLAVTLFIVTVKTFEIASQSLLFKVLVETRLYQVSTVSAGGSKINPVCPAIFVHGPPAALALCHW